MLSRDQNGNLPSWAKAGIAAAGLTGIGGIVGLNSASSVAEGERAVVTNFGGVSREIGSGLNFHWPWQGVRRMSIQSQTVNIPLEVYSKDSQLAPENILSVTFSLPAENVREVYAKYGEKYFETVLKNPVENIFRECFGRMTADQIIANREVLNADISKLLKAEFESRHLEFERISISIKFNEAYNHAAEESAIARITVNTETQNLERDTIKAKQVVIKAQADGESAIIKTSSEAKGIEAKGAAEAKVISLKAAAMKENPDYPKMIAAEKWDGKMPQTMVPGQAIPFIELTGPQIQRPAK
jgi:regulator of protease activity HflC (stomatin/prohibitin superfamily)